MDTLPNSSEAVIVGAGPTGLALANVLAMNGVSFLLLDQAAQGAQTSRAAVVHARTLEVLEALGISARLCERGLQVPFFTVRDGDHVLAEIRFDGLPTAYPYALMIPQDVTETILVERLHENGGEVRRPFCVTDLTPLEDGVLVHVDSATGSHTVRANYVVGADGMHSTVRECAGIGFKGGRYAQSFVLADVRMRWPLRHEEVVLFLSPSGLAVVAPLPHGRHRIVAAVDDAPEQPDIAYVQQILGSRGPTRPGAHIDELVWGSRFRVHHRVADGFRAGRVLLAGDAAHVHSPAGGQGMNTGIQDAVALGSALTAVLTGAGVNGRLDAYERRRRPVAQHVVAFTDRLTRAATLRGSAARTLRNSAIRLLSGLPPLRRRLAVELAELRYR